MAISDVTLVKPDATKTITLKAAQVTMQGQVSGQILLPLPAKNTLGVDLGYRPRTFTVTGKMTAGGGFDPKVAREDLEDAWLNWWSNGDGQAKFVWGTKSDASAYDFKVFIKSIVIKFDSTKPGTSPLPVYDYTLVMQEVGVVGALN